MDEVDSTCKNITHLKKKKKNLRGEKCAENWKKSLRLFVKQGRTTTKHKKCWKASTEKFSEIISLCPLGLLHKYNFE